MLDELLEVGCDNCLVGRDDRLASIEGTQDIGMCRLEAAHALDDGSYFRVVRDIVEVRSHARFRAAVRQLEDARDLEGGYRAFDDLDNATTDRTVAKQGYVHISSNLSNV